LFCHISRCFCSFFLRQMVLIALPVRAKLRAGLKEKCVKNRFWREKFRLPSLLVFCERSRFGLSLGSANLKLH
jgi:hypothetical protein